MLQKAQVEIRLKALGAFYVIDVDDLHEVWGTAWGHFIWIPMVGPLGGLHEDDMLEIEDDIRSSKP